MIQTGLNATHDPRRRSWIASANDERTDFPIQNLPLGVFRRSGGPLCGGVAIGDQIFDLGAGLAAGLFKGTAEIAARAAAGESLNALLALGNGPASALRARLSDLLRHDSAERAAVEALAGRILVPMQQAVLALPAAVTHFTDMSTSLFHMGRSRGNDANGNPIVPPPLKWMPTGYNGRASSIVVSGTPVRRPNGQWPKDGEESGATPAFGPEPRMDYEMELATWVGTPGNALGKTIPIDKARDYVFGYCLLNDWSARTIQRAEAALGPLVSKSMATTISPWIVTAEALAPYRIPAFQRAADHPAAPAYLSCRHDQAAGGLDLAMDAFVTTPTMRRQGDSPFRICSTSFKYMYWTAAQVLTHLASNGCNLSAGNLVGSGTCSGPLLEQAACLSEKSKRGTLSWSLPSGEHRTYLEDGDEIILRARAARDGYATIGFGECVGRLEPALS